MLVVALDDKLVCDGICCKYLFHNINNYINVFRIDVWCSIIPTNALLMVIYTPRTSILTIYQVYTPMTCAIEVPCQTKQVYNQKHSTEQNKDSFTLSYNAFT